MSSSTPSSSLVRPIKSGKVREIYDAGEHFVIVASDRVSAFDCILPTPIPEKGRVLTTLSNWWFERTGHIVPNHIVSTDAGAFPAPLDAIKDEWSGRAVLVRKASVLPVECVVRGYLAGSGWKEYQKSQSVCGVALPEGLLESDRLPRPIFTPTTKADEGHDEPISFEQTEEILGRERAEQVREVSLRLYEFAAQAAGERGVILADTKFEFGLIDGMLHVVDEIFTPDSSRFWDARSYEPGRAQDSFDKQFVRDYLEGLDWDKTPPAPALPPEIVSRTQAKYFEAFERVTGQAWRAL
jgi:phosphoribosylaminoimidazole-succinocarboxamide synthase